MSHCIVPDWNLKKHYQIPQAHVDEDEYELAAGNKNKKKMKKSSCYHSNATSSHLVPMTKYEEENGVGGAKPTWVRTGDTLESIVHHATHPQDNTGVVPTLPKKRTRPEYHFNSSACASASANATFCADTIWASFDSPSSFKTIDDDSACNAASGSQNEEGEMRGETERSHSTRRSRTTDIHNQSERRRRCRINQKMKTLQRLVPNANKTDKASMLDLVIEYLKQLQAQIQMMSSVRYHMPQIMMPLGMQQQQFQMSLMARMGMGGGLGMRMGMGMLDMTGMARSVAAQPLWPLFNPSHPFLVSPPIIPTSAPPNPDHGAATASLAMSDPYCNFLAQAMNMELHNKMAALYKQQVYQVRLGD